MTNQEKYNISKLNLQIIWENEPDPYAGIPEKESINLSWTLEDGDDGGVNTCRRFCREIRKLRTHTLNIKIDPSAYFGARSWEALPDPNKKWSAWLHEVCTGVSCDWLTGCFLVVDQPRCEVSTDPRMRRLDNSIIRDVRITKMFYTDTYEMVRVDRKERIV